MGSKPSSTINSGQGAQCVHHQESQQPRRGKEPYAAGTSVTQSSFDTISNASSSNTTSNSRLIASSLRTSGKLYSGGAIPSSRSNSTIDSRSHASSSSATTTDWFSRCATVGSSSSTRYKPEKAKTSSHARAYPGSLVVQVNRQPRRRRSNYLIRSSLDHYNLTSKQQIQYPSAVVFNINCATVLSASSHQAGFGAVIRTQEGKFVAAFSGKLASCEDAVVADIICIEKGMRLASWMKLLEVQVRSDSWSVITELQKPSDNWLAFFPYYYQMLYEVKGMAATFKNCKFMHVKQEANCVAHWLAMYGFSLEAIHSWSFTAPDFLLPALQQDVSLGYT